MRVKNKSFLIASLISISGFAQNSNLIAKWNFNGNANDSSGNPNNLTVYNATLTKDRFNNDNSAYYFNGINAYLETLVYLLPSGSTNRTFTGWFKSDYKPITDTAYDFTIFDYGSEVNFQRLSMGLYNKGYLMIETQATNSSTYVNNYNYINNSWYFFALTYDGTNLKIYTNGNLAGTFAATLDTRPDNNLFRIGRKINNQNQYFKGSIDDFAIYNKVLTDAEVLALYQSQSLTTSENNKSENIKIYPTFTNEKVYIDNKKFTKLKIFLFNSAGQNIKNIETNSDKIELNLSDLTKGIYFIKIIDKKNGTENNQKIIKE